MSTGSSMAEQLRARRATLGLTQAELAERAGISERAVSDIERGLRRVVYRDTARRLVQALELAGEEATRFEAAVRGRPSALRLHGPVVPVPRTSFVGRSAEVRQVTALLLDEETRLLTLAGPGGVGKTRLALEVAAEVGDDFSHGVAFVPLGDVRAPEFVLPAIADVLKVRTPADLLAEVARGLRSRPLLLILDSFEHLLAAGPLLADIVASSAPTKVIVTSRIPVNIRAERLVQLRPLEVVDAIAMFTGCVRAQEPALAEALDGELVAAVCRRLDGLPLAIELAAARARRLGLSEVSAHLERRLPLLEDGPVDLPQRQRSISATIAWSYDLLASADRRLLEQLSTFAGGWTLESAAAVCRVPEDLVTGVERLVDSSLVLRDAGGRETRYRMLDTVREYAAQRLYLRIGSSGVASARRRHARFFSALAEQAEPKLRAAEQQVWANRLAAEHDNLRAAIAWAIADGDAETALRMGGALWMFWRLTGAFSEGRAWLRQVLEMDARGREDLRAAALWGAGWLAYQQGDFRETAGRGAELSEWARRAGDAGALRNGLTLLGEERMSAGDFIGASHRFDEALAIARGLPSGWLLATSCLNRSVAALHVGDLDRAGALLDEAEALYRDLGDDRFVARVWLQRAYSALLQHDVSRARGMVAAGLSQALALDDQWAVAEQLAALAAVLAADGDGRGAAFAAGAAETAWERIGARPHPADRRSAERWLAPAQAMVGEEWGAGVARGRGADPDMVAGALRRPRRAGDPDRVRDSDRRR